MLVQALWIAVAYVLGSVPWGLVIAKTFCGIDPRTDGSRSTGATNVSRLCGFGWGVATLLCDVLKGALPVWAALAINPSPVFVSLTGLACVLGHVFSCFMKFKGGKAVSAGAAVGLMIDWRLFVILVAVFALMALLSKRASVCSMACAVVLAAGTPLFTKEPMLIALAVFTGLLVLVMHRANIRRLLRGEEPPFHLGSRKK